MYYRGIKHTPQDVAKEQKIVSAGIYRGIRHDAIESESKKTSTTVYPKMVPKSDMHKVKHQKLGKVDAYIGIFIFSIVLILFLS